MLKPSITTNRGMHHHRQFAPAGTERVVNGRDGVSASGLPRRSGYAGKRCRRGCGGEAKAAMVSTGSVGGSGGASGVGLQDRVFACAAVAVLAEQSLPGLLLPGTAVRVGAQTGQPLDDVGVETDRGGFALIQAKVGLGLGQAEGSPLADAVNQALNQYLSVCLPSTGGLRSARDVECADAVRDGLFKVAGTG
jgi:hypothetical protein